MFKFFDNNEVFIEYKWAFGNDFLGNLFKDKYQCKYSMIGDGIYYLITIDNKIYHVDIKECKKMVLDDGKKAFRDETKDVVVDKICEKLKEHNISYSKNCGKTITFKHNQFMFKIEVVKKQAIPQ